MTCSFFKSFVFSKIVKQIVNKKKSEILITTILLPAKCNLFLKVIDPIIQINTTAVLSVPIPDMKVMGKIKYKKLSKL